MAHRFRFTGVLSAAVVVACGLGMAPARAADDGYENVFSSVLTAVGVLSADPAPEIDYRERAPLVLPPKQALVKPQPEGVARTAAWPNDPDVARRKKAADDARAPIVGTFNHTNDHPLSKDEQLKYRAAQVPEDPDAYGCSIQHKSQSHCHYNPDDAKLEEQRYQAMNPNRGNAVTANVEPERQYLTQPPKGYLKATKTIAATREGPVVKRDDSSPLSTYIHPDEGKIDPLQ